MNVDTIHNDGGKARDCSNNPSTANAKVIFRNTRFADAVVPRDIFGAGLITGRSRFWVYQVLSFRLILNTGCSTKKDAERD